MNMNQGGDSLQKHNPCQYYAHPRQSHTLDNLQAL